MGINKVLYYNVRTYRLYKNDHSSIVGTWEKVQLDANS